MRAASHCMFLDLTHSRCFRAMFDVEAYGFLFHAAVGTPVKSWLILYCTISVLVNTVVRSVPDGKQDRKPCSVQYVIFELGAGRAVAARRRIYRGWPQRC